MPQQLSLHLANLVNRGHPASIVRIIGDNRSGTNPSYPVNLVNLVNPAQALGIRIKPRVSSSCSSCFKSVRMKSDDAPERLLNPVNRSRISKIHKIFRISKRFSFDTDLILLICLIL